MLTPEQASRSSSSSVGFGINAVFNAKSPFLKPVETAATFQKVRTQLGQETLANAELRYTLCDGRDLNSRPFANLFQSFRLPNTAAERSILRRKLLGTALVGLADVEKFIAIEIPRNKYGEMVDGKSIELKIPQTSGGTFYAATCFGSYYNFNTALNAQVSDANAVSSLFSGVEPTEENDFNTNIAYLFSNDIKRPQDNFINTDVGSVFEFTLAPGAKVTVTGLTTTLAPGKTYQSTALWFLRTRDNIKVRVQTALGLLDFEEVAEYDTIQAFRLKYEVTGFNLQNESAEEFTGYLAMAELRPISTSAWSSWTSQNRFATTANGSGKQYGELVDANYGLLMDSPVGIAYLDKGFFIITNPTLVANFDLSEALTMDANGTVKPYPQSVETKNSFTQVFFPSTSTAGFRRSSAIYRSVATEYNQGYTCLALPNEFTSTNNPTYRQAYPVGSTDVGLQPLHITEVGLYNKYGELIAIAKSTKPLLKTKQSVAVINIGLKI